MKVFKAINPATSKVEFYFSNPEVHANPIKVYANEAEGIEEFLKRTGNLELVAMYKGRFRQVMALNLDFYSTPLCMYDMMNQLFEEIKTNEDFDLEEKIINSMVLPSGKICRQTVKNIEKRRSTITSTLLSLFIAWKSDYAIRYGRSKTYYANIRRYYTRDYYEMCHYLANKIYSMTYNINILNTMFDTLHDLGYVEVKKGDFIPEIGKGVQTRIFPQEKLINLFKKYEDQIDLNCVGYLRDTEHIITHKKDYLKNFNPVTIRDDNKQYIPLYEIQKNVSMKLELDGVLEKINKINDYYRKNLKIEIVNPVIKNNDDIRVRSKAEHRLDSEDDLETALKNKHTLLPSGNILLENIKMRRIFNNGTLTDGGRLYNDYQNLPKDIRQNMLINGEEVTCLDMKASQINMLYHNNNSECKLKDPYNIFENYTCNCCLEHLPDFHKELRAIVKKVTLITINAKNKQGALGAINNELGEEIIKFKAKYQFDYNVLFAIQLNLLNRTHVDFIKRHNIKTTGKEFDTRQILADKFTQKTNINEQMMYKYYKVKDDRFTEAAQYIQEQQTKYYDEMEKDLKEKEIKQFASLLIEIIKTIHEPIKKKFHSGEGVKLQKYESDIVINTICRMMDEQDTPVISVHDEVICMKSKASFVHDAFIQEYRKVFNGYSCVLTDSTDQDFTKSDEYQMTTEEQLIRIKKETEELLESKRKNRNLVYK